MHSDSQPKAERLDWAGLMRFAGTAVFVLALFVAYFHISLWMAAENGDWFNALFGAIGVLGICAVPPVILIAAFRAWRAGSYGRLESDYLRLQSLLLSGPRSHGVPTHEVVHDLIAIYGEADSVAGTTGRWLSVSLGVCLLLIGYFLQNMVAGETFTQDQATLLILFTLFITVGFYTFLWPEASPQGDRFDPSHAIAQAIGR